MSGYAGYSMSKNAVLAYSEGKKPMSKWTKSEILTSLSVTDEEKKKLKKYCLATLRQYFLRYSEWHHTSNHFNCTDFYEIVEPDTIDYDALDEAEAFNRENIRTQKEKKTEAKKLKKAFCRWIGWEGTRRHPKVVKKEGYCILSGSFAYTQEKTKKKISGNHFEVVQIFSKAPKGTAKIFEDIKRYIAKQ